MQRSLVRVAGTALCLATTACLAQSKAQDLNDIIDPGLLIVRFDPNLAPRSAHPIEAIEKSGARVRHESKVLPGLVIYEIDCPIGQAMEAFAREPSVLYAEPSYRLQLCSQGTACPTDDPLFDEQWGLLNYGLPTTACPDVPSVDGVADINVCAAWEIYTGSSTNTVALVDTGISIQSDYHEDLVASRWFNSGDSIDSSDNGDPNNLVDDYYGWNFASNTNDTSDVQPHPGHGTRAAGVIGAEANNELGIAGINWEVRLLPVVIFPYDDVVSPGSSTALAIEAWDYILTGLNPADSPRISYNAFGTVFGEPISVLEYLAAASVSYPDHLFVFAAGNSAETIFPSRAVDLPNLICVGDLLPNGSSTWASDGVDLLAPGLMNVTTIIATNSPATNGYSECVQNVAFGSTSSATAHMAGAAALLQSYKDDVLTTTYWDAADIRKHLIDTASRASTHFQPISTLGDRTSAVGTLDIGAAMETPYLFPDIELVDPIPESIGRGCDFTVRAKIDMRESSAVTGIDPLRLFVKPDTGTSYAEVTFGSPDMNGVREAVVVAPMAASRLELYLESSFEAIPTQVLTKTLPIDLASEDREPFIVELDEEVLVHETGFESGSDGWTVITDTGVSGAWERGDPDASVAQDGDAHGGTYCFVTGMAVTSGDPFTSDVDAPTSSPAGTVLYSPVFDLTPPGGTATKAKVSYWRWFGEQSDGSTSISVDITGDGSAWRTIEDPVRYYNSCGWIYREFEIDASDDEYTDEFQVRIRVIDNNGTDNGGDELLEAMLDDVRITTYYRACTGDVNRDGIVDDDDFTSWIAAYNSGSMKADCNENGGLDSGDFAAWIASYNSGC